MMLKNALYLDICVKYNRMKNDLSLFHFQLRLINENQDTCYENFNNCLYLLEEYSQYTSEDSNYNNHSLVKNLLIG